MSALSILLVSSAPSCSNQKNSGLTFEEVLTLEFPTDLFRCRADKLQREFLKPICNPFIVRKGRSNVSKRRDNLGPNMVTIFVVEVLKQSQ